MDNNDQLLSQDEESHGFNLETGKTWIYPTNYPIRDYQYNIVSEALFNNTMVCLPTGLGKTFIAAVVMYNYFRWYPHGKIIFMAPTKPLVKQQVEACYDIMAIPKDATAELTGTTAQSSRDEIWEEKRVFFITPQVLQNDLERIARLGKQIKCLVFDEAHKARGNFAYCEVIKKIFPISKNFRVLALTATPGSTVSDVVKVCSDLLISHLEIRTEDSEDVAKFVFKKNIETIVVPFDAKLRQIMNDYNMVLDRFVRVLVNHRVIQGNCNAITKGRMFYIKKEYEEKNRYTRGPQHNEIMKTLNVCLILYHAHEVLTKHGLRGFLTFFKEHEDKPLLRHIDEIGRIVEDVSSYLGVIPDVDMLPDGTIPEVSEETRFGHPKFYKLAEVLTCHFNKLHASGENGRVIVFCEYRESVMEAYTILLMYRPLVKPRIFLGQATITQKQQLNVLQSFRSGDCNTLVSTSIGEEGLDIGDVNLVVCFDISSKSSIRMIQRMGRTGRKREGNVIMLVTEGKEQQLLRDCLAHKDYMINAMKTSKELHKSLYKNSARMIPVGITPVCNKIFITVEKHQKKDQKNGSLLNLFDKMKGASSSFNYEDVEVLEFTDRIPENHCLFNKVVIEAFAPPALNTLVYGVEVNRVLQSGYGEIGSSDDSKALVSLLEFANSLRFDIPSSQCSVINKQSLKSDKLKQSDIRSLFQKQTLTQMEFQQTINIVTTNEQQNEHKELQSELNNYLSLINFDCKICNNLFTCNTYKQDAAILEPWIVPEINVLDSLTKDSLRDFVEGLRVEKEVFDDDIMKEFQVDDFDLGVKEFELTPPPEKVRAFDLPGSAKKILTNYNKSDVSHENNCDASQKKSSCRQKNVFDIQRYETNKIHELSDLNNLDCNEFSSLNKSDCALIDGVSSLQNRECEINDAFSGLENQNCKSKNAVFNLENCNGIKKDGLSGGNETISCFNEGRKKTLTFSPVPKTLEKSFDGQQNALEFFKMNDISELFEDGGCNSDTPKGFVKKSKLFERKANLKNSISSGENTKSSKHQGDASSKIQDSENNVKHLSFVKKAVKVSDLKNFEIHTINEQNHSRIGESNSQTSQIQTINEQTPTKKSHNRRIVESPDMFDTMSSDDSNQSQPIINNNKPNQNEDLFVTSDTEIKKQLNNANIVTEQFKSNKIVIKENNSNGNLNNSILFKRNRIGDAQNKTNKIDLLKTNGKLNNTLCFKGKTIDIKQNTKDKLNNTISINDICGDDLLDLINCKLTEEKTSSTNFEMKDNLNVGFIKNPAEVTKVSEFNLDESNVGSGWKSTDSEMKDNFNSGRFTKNQAEVTKASVFNLGESNVGLRNKNSCSGLRKTVGNKHFVPKMKEKRNDLNSTKIVDVYDDDFLNFLNVNEKPVSDQPQIRCVNIEKLITQVDSSKNIYKNNDDSKFDGINLKLELSDRRLKTCAGYNSELKTSKEQLKTHDRINLKRKFCDGNNENLNKFDEERKISDENAADKSKSSENPGKVSFNFDDIFGDDFADLTKPIEENEGKVAKRRKFSCKNTDEKETIFHNEDNCQNEDSIKDSTVDCFGDFFNFAKPAEKKQDTVLKHKQISSKTLEDEIFYEDSSKSDNSSEKSAKAKLDDGYNARGTEKKQKPTINPEDIFDDEFFELTTQKSSDSGDLFGLETQKNVEERELFTSATQKSADFLSLKTTPKCCPSTSAGVDEKIFLGDEFFGLPTQQPVEENDFFDLKTQTSTEVNDFLNLRTEKSALKINCGKEIISDDDIFGDEDFSVLKDEEEKCNRSKFITANKCYTTPEKNKKSCLKLKNEVNEKTSKLKSINKISETNSSTLKYEENLKTSKSKSSPKRNAELEDNSDSDATIICSPDTLSVFCDLPKKTPSTDDDDFEQSPVFNSFSFDSKKENLVQTKNIFDKREYGWNISDGVLEKCNDGENLKKGVLEKRNDGEDFNNCVPHCEDFEKSVLERRNGKNCKKVVLGKRNDGNFKKCVLEKRKDKIENTAVEKRRDVQNIKKPEDKESIKKGVFEERKSDEDFELPNAPKILKKKPPTALNTKKKTYGIEKVGEKTASFKENFENGPCLEKLVRSERKFGDFEIDAILEKYNKTSPVLNKSSLSSPTWNKSNISMSSPVSKCLSNTKKSSQISMKSRKLEHSPIKYKSTPTVIYPSISDFSTVLSPTSNKSNASEFSPVSSKSHNRLSNPQLSPILNKSQSKTTQYSPLSIQSQSKTTQSSQLSIKSQSELTNISPILNKSQPKITQFSPILNKSQSCFTESKTRSLFSSPESPVFRKNRRKRAKLNFDSPISISNGIGLNEKSEIVHISSDDDFEESCVKARTPLKKKKIRRDFNGFFETEAALSSNDEASEDEESGSSLDVMDESFVNDETQDFGNSTKMHAHYLQTARSPTYKKGRFKIPQLPKIIDKEIFSQAVTNEDNTYLEDSFCVGSDDETATAEELSELEIAERILKQRKKEAPENGGTKKRRRILLRSSSESD